MGFFRHIVDLTESFHCARCGRVEPKVAMQIIYVSPTNDWTKGVVLDTMPICLECRMAFKGELVIPRGKRKKK